MNLFGANLDRLMTYRGVNNSTLAERIGVSREYCRQIRDGKIPSDEIIDKICSVLNWSPITLFGPIYAANLTELCEQHNLTPAALATLTGLRKTTINAMLAGKRAPSGKCLEKLATAFGCSTNDILHRRHMISLSKWANKEKIPLSRARDLFKLGLLPKAIKRDSVILVPSNLKPLEDHERLVVLAKRRPKWGPAGHHNFYLRLNRWMEKSDVSVMKIAEATKVNATTVSHWRAGIRTPSEERLPVIAEVCGCTVEELIAPPRWNYFARNLRHALAMSQYSETRFAISIRVSPATVNAWLRGKDHPDEALLPVIAVNLKVKVADLLSPLREVKIDKAA